ncbi:MAG: enolase C-terminal domain-like protein [Desulfobacterales bacterium]
MKIDHISVYPVLLPFSSEFSHSLRKRNSVKNIVVQVVAQQGKIKGYGEGAPRSFVTGESQESAARRISRFITLDNFPWELNHVSQIWNFADGLFRGKARNASICALETALLDALGKSQSRNIIDYFPKDFMTTKVYYGAALPLAGKQRIVEICGLIKKMKVKKVKLKLGKDLSQNREILQAVRTVFGEDCDLKVDINCVWNYALALKHVSLIKNYGITFVEQPMRPDDPETADIADLMEKTGGVVLMADESACSLDDMEKIAEDGYYKMINVRLSKCGGFRNSLKIIDYLRSNGISFQIGCHLGESGILSAAGRILCLLCNDAVYCDGSYDEFLLEKNVTVEDVSMGPGGEADPLKGSGLGIEVSDKSLAELSEGFNTITIDRP